MTERPTKLVRGGTVNLDMPDARFRQVQIVTSIKLHMLAPTPEPLGLHYMLLCRVTGAQQGSRDTIMQGTFELVDFIAHTKTRASFLYVPFGHAVEDVYCRSADIQQMLAFKLFEDGKRLRYVQAEL